MKVLAMIILCKFRGFFRPVLSEITQYALKGVWDLLAAFVSLIGFALPFGQRFSIPFGRRTSFLDKRNT